MDGDAKSITTNVSPLIRDEELDGRQYKVAPVILLTEGVANNALYPASELSKFAKSWDGRPLPVFHPEKEGRRVSANSPEAIQSQSVGTIFNTRFEDGKLKGEAWIDIKKGTRISPRLMELLSSNNPQIEVSTGLFTEDEQKAGSFNGVNYQVIARNYRPDHLALLPDGEGACSWADGAGLPRLNEQEKSNPVMHILTKILNVLTPKPEDPPEPKVNDIEGGTPPKIEPEIGTTKGDGEMDEKIDALILNELTHLNEDNREWLKTLSEDQLDLLEPIAPKVIEPTPEVVPEPTLEPAPATNAPVITLADVKAMVTEGVAEALKANEKKPILERLTTNGKCTVSAATLALMPEADLVALEKSLMPENYSGKGGFRGNVVEDEDDGPEPMPAVFPIAKAE